MFVHIRTCHSIICAFCHVPCAHFVTPNIHLFELFVRYAILAWALLPSWTISAIGSDGKLSLPVHNGEYEDCLFQALELELKCDI